MTKVNRLSWIDFHGHGAYYTGIAENESWTLFIQKVLCKQQTDSETQEQQHGCSFFSALKMNMNNQFPVPPAQPAHGDEAADDAEASGVYWKEMKDEFEKLERSNSYSDILQFVQKKMPHLGGRSDLEAAAIPPVPAAVQEEPTPTLLLVRSDSSTFTGALLVAEPAALEASLIEINEILGNEESLRDMAKDRCLKNTELKRLESQLSAEVSFVCFGTQSELESTLRSKSPLRIERPRLRPRLRPSIKPISQARIQMQWRYRSICSFCQGCRIQEA
jgi:hypothetical protein